MSNPHIVRPLPLPDTGLCRVARQCRVIGGWAQIGGSSPTPVPVIGPDGAPRELPFVAQPGDVVGIDVSKVPNYTSAGFTIMTEDM